MTEKSAGKLFEVELPKQTDPMRLERAAPPWVRLELIVQFIDISRIACIFFDRDCMQSVRARS